MRAIRLKRGMVFNQDDKLIKVLRSNHHKPGKGNTVIQMGLRDVMSGAVTHKTMCPGEKVELVNTALKKAQYLHNGDTNLIFIDTDTYGQHLIPREHLVVEVKFLMSNTGADLKFTDKGKLVGINLPSVIKITVKGTRPGAKGATAAGGSKPTIMDAGLAVTIPDFIKEGEESITGTEDSDYKGRADSIGR